ncbi:MAG: PDZ domain-containing protein, partial [Chloroflexi bacterium]|nr:PDZ domain-containing protein [Chloroflexota bacterium]
TYNFFMQPIPQEGAGSGFIYDSNGHIITNYHVVENAEEVTVGFSSGKVLPATIVGTDSSTDLAVLRIDPDGLPPPLPLADSRQLRVGQFVVAIGNPFRLGSTLTLGIISALERVIESPDGRFIGEAIQTDAAINPGNSGGPLLNLAGEVIGVNSQIVGVTGANVGIGFAIAANTVRRVAPELISRGRYPHPWLGISALPLSKGIADAFRQAGVSMAADEGLLILEVTRGGPAAGAGIRGGDRVVRIGNTRVPVGGDIITAIDGRSMASLQQLTVYLESTKRVGETVQVTLLRNGREMTIDVTLGERPSN